MRAVLNLGICRWHFLRFVSAVVLLLLLLITTLFVAYIYCVGCCWIMFYERRRARAFDFPTPSVFICNLSTVLYRSESECVLFSLILSPRLLHCNQVGICLSIHALGVRDAIFYQQHIAGHRCALLYIRSSTLSLHEAEKRGINWNRSRAEQRISVCHRHAKIEFKNIMQILH
jgi:hypothetical protein